MGLDKNFMLIAGPCSAESEEQVYNTANEIQKIVTPEYFRAGIWKPRTRPGSFEGVGAKGLQWLVKIREKFGFKIITEVITPKHLELCLNHKLDAVWLGARTVANPVSVAEICNSLDGAADLPVFVKNPVSEDLNLWLGAIERIQKAGVKKIYAIFRGFSNLYEKDYRNRPRWDIPLELKRIHPEIKIICDPSHIAGKSELVEDVSILGYEFGLNGLMIETHINPEQALSDARQQLKPEKIASILSKLAEKKNDLSTISETDKIILDSCRGYLDCLDDEIINLLKLRFNTVKRIGEVKERNNLRIIQPDRWQAILQKVENSAKKQGLNSEFLTEMYELIHVESIKKQMGK